MGWFNFFRPGQNDIGIDLGTVNTLICTTQKGIVLDEPSVIAVDQSKRPARVMEVGQKAWDMIGRTPDHIKAICPLRDGVIADFEWAEVMLKSFIQRVMKQRMMSLPPRVVVGIPSKVTEVERRAVGDAAYSAGARLVYLVEEAMAAAIGSDMPVNEPMGSMVVDMGGGTTDIAVLSLNGIVTSNSVRLAGNQLVEDVKTYLKQTHNMTIGDHTAEEIKMRVGSASRSDELIDDDLEMDVRGINLSTGLPITVTVRSAEIREAFRPTLMSIIGGIKIVLEKTPPELAGDIIERGIVLTGGGALLRGFDEMISRELGLPVHAAANPLTSVVRGTERILREKQFEKILEYNQYDPHSVMI